MGSIYLRGKTYWVKFYLPGRKEPVRVSAKTDSVRAAKKRLAELEAAKAPTNGKLLFRELLIGYLREQIQNNRKAAGITAQRLNKNVMPYFGDFPVSGITPSLIQAYVEKRMNEEAANATINRELAGIRRAFNLALEQGLIQAMPKIKALREASPREGFFERPELGKVLWKIRPRVVRHIVLFAYYTGWRTGEILNLEWQWVDFGSGEVRLSDSKSGEARVVHMTRKLRRLLKLRAVDGSGPYVFAWSDGSPVKASGRPGTKRVWKPKFPVCSTTYGELRSGTLPGPTLRPRLL